MADVSRLLETMHALREPPPPASIVPALIMAGVGALAALAIFVVIWRARHRGGAMRRAAEAALAASRPLAPAERLAAQAQLLRRLVRSLDGEAKAQGRVWLERLDAIFATQFFTQGDGAAYGEALYRPHPTVDVAALDRSLAGLLAKVRT